MKAVRYFLLAIGGLLFLGGIAGLFEDFAAGIVTMALGGTLTLPYFKQRAKKSSNRGAMVSTNRESSGKMVHKASDNYKNRIDLIRGDVLSDNVPSLHASADSTLTPFSSELQSGHNPRRNGIIAKPMEIRATKVLASIRDYVVLDTETTGLDCNNDRIVEVALICYEKGRETGRFSTLVDPQMPISLIASSINHITDADVVGAPTIEAVMPDILQRIRDKVVIGHNITFDLRFLGRAVRGETLQIEYIDTIALAKRAFPGQPSYKLENLAKIFGFSDGRLHRALDDAEITASLFDACRKAIMDDYQRELAERKAEREIRKAKRLEEFAWSSLIDKNFVFTGDFLSNRRELENAVEKVGANLRTEINGNTDYLVAGDVTHLPQWAVERKYLKAKELIEKGGKLRIITEEQYFNMILEVLRTKLEKID